MVLQEELLAIADISKCQTSLLYCHLLKYMGMLAESLVQEYPALSHVGREEKGR